MPPVRRQRSPAREPAEPAEPAAPAAPAAAATATSPALTTYQFVVSAVFGLGTLTTLGYASNASIKGDFESYEIQQWMAAIIMAAATVALYIFCLTRPLTIKAFFLLSTLASVRGLFFSKTLTLGEIHGKWQDAFKATTALCSALYAMLEAWAAVLLPLADELLDLAKPVWDRMPFPLRCITALFSLSLVHEFGSSDSRFEPSAVASGLAALAFHATFLPVALALTYGLPLLDKTALQLLAWLLYLGAPAALTVWAVNARQRGYWRTTLLLYWSTVPLLALVFPARLPGGETGLSVFIVLLVWLSCYGGGSSLWKVVELVASALSPGSLFSYLSSFFDNFGNFGLMRGVDWVKGNKAAGATSALVALGVSYQLLSKLAGTISLLVLLQSARGSVDLAERAGDVRDPGRNPREVDRLVKFQVTVPAPSHPGPPPRRHPHPLPITPLTLQLTLPTSRRRTSRRASASGSSSPRCSRRSRPPRRRACGWCRRSSATRSSSTSSFPPSTGYRRR